MNAGLVGWRIRWTHRTFASVSFWLLATACAEPATVDPALVPEASVEAGREGGDADPDAAMDASTGSGGSGGSGGAGGTGGGGTGGGGGAVDARSDTADAGGEVGDALADTSADTPLADTSADTGAPTDAASDAARDPISEPPPQDTGRGDTVTDAAGDRGG